MFREVWFLCFFSVQRLFSHPSPPPPLILQADSLPLTFLSADPTAPNVVVTRLTLVCDSAPGPITMDLTGRHRLCHCAQKGTSKGPGMLHIEKELVLGMLQWILEEL